MSYKFEDNSDGIKKGIEDAANAGMESALLVVEASAKSKAPVDLGELRDTLDHSIKNTGGNIVGKVGSPKDYAIYPEFGTGKFAENGAGRKGGWSYTLGEKDDDGDLIFYHTYGQEPQPYLRPAFRENKKTIIDMLGKSYGAKF